MKRKLIMPVILSLTLIITVLYFYYNQSKQKYDLITYDRFLTLQDDGGTHYDRKYTIDLFKKTVIKKEDYYKGFQGIQYKDKTLYQKKINNQEVKKIKNLMEDIIKNQKQYSIDQEKSYLYYSLYVNNQEIKIYDPKIIQKLEKLLTI